jgi:site-specific DNA recombinase
VGLVVEADGRGSLLDAPRQVFFGGAPLSISDSLMWQPRPASHPLLRGIGAESGQRDDWGMSAESAAVTAGVRSTAHGPVPDLLGWYIQRDRGRRTRSPRRAVPEPVGGLIRFAFYGRISTEDWQDPGSSGLWQRDFAEELIAGRGVIVAAFFDVGHSRTRGWERRPQAAALLAQLADPQRGWNAIVVGEFERAFYGEQFEQMAPVFAAHGVGVWLPELDGPADLDDPLHVSLLRMLGIHSRREVQRARFRAKAAMRAQVEGQGRNLGGRPPYGYRLVDAGPHQNKAHARWGRRAQRLDPDPVTGQHVQWMFAQRLA